MSRYAGRTVNPYRGSTGTLARAPSPVRNNHVVPVNPPSPTESTCSSCDGSLPLNTPWSGTPTSSMTSIPPAHHQQHRHGHQRRQSISDGVRIVEAPPRMSTDGRPAPLIIHKQPMPSPPQTSRSLNAYHNESRSHGTYRSDHSPHSLIVPASSISDRDRRQRRDSISGPLSARTLASHGYTRYFNSVDIQDDHEGNTDGGRRGRTRFPRKLISKEAAEEMRLPWTEDPDGCIVVLQALGRNEISRLVDLTEEIRRECTVISPGLFLN